MDNHHQSLCSVSIFVRARMCVYIGLCVQYGDGKKRRKPNYSSVDLSEVEWEDKDDTVRSSPRRHKMHGHAVLVSGDVRP